MFEILTALSVPGDPAKANDDAFQHDANAAIVMDGATGLGENLLPGPSDARWLAQFGARRVMAHLADMPPKKALRAALLDAEKSYAGLRRREPVARYEIPYAAMMLAVETDKGFDTLWYGDCGALVKRPDAAAEIVGESVAVRKREAARARRLSQGASTVTGGTTGDIGRDGPVLESLRASRNRRNIQGGYWTFAPDRRAADHVHVKKIAAPPGTLVLLASDGFLALLSDYGRYDADALIAAAADKGLPALIAELRAVEEADPAGARFPRFKKSDDATAVLLRLTGRQAHPGFPEQSSNPPRTARSQGRHS